MIRDDRTYIGGNEQENWGDFKMRFSEATTASVNRACDLNSRYVQNKCWHNVLPLRAA